VTAERGYGVVVHGGDVATAVDLARRADDAGFESVWTTEFYDRSAIVTLAAMATVTSRVTLGSAIAYAVGRSPLVLAIEAADLDELSGGRLVLGLGTGSRRMQADWHGADPASPAPRMEELVPLLRRLVHLGPEGVEHDGRFYRVSLTPTGYERAVAPRDFPILLAGVNRRMIAAAGTVADGLVGHPIFTQRYVEEVARPVLDEAAGEAGRPRPELAGYLMCAIAEDAGAARRDAKAQIAFYALVRTYKAVMDLHGFTPHADEIRAAWKRGDQDGMIDAVTDEMLAAVAIAGTPDDVRDQVRGRVDAYDRVLLYAPSFGLSPGRFAERLDAIIETFGARR
jgi:probable F420-dependent oxidoreductase